jgi:hypothetical protein
MPLNKGTSYDAPSPSSDSDRMVLGVAAVLEQHPNLIALLPEGLLEGTGRDALHERALEERVDLSPSVENGEMTEERRRVRAARISVPKLDARNLVPQVRRPQSDKTITRRPIMNVLGTDQCGHTPHRRRNESPLRGLAPLTTYARWCQVVLGRRRSGRQRRR